MRMAMIAITTSSSISVNAPRLERFDITTTPWVRNTSVTRLSCRRGSSTHGEEGLAQATSLARVFQTLLDRVALSPQERGSMSSRPRGSPLLVGEVDAASTSPNFKQGNCKVGPLGGLIREG